jgi:hypothetical protein
VGSKIAGLAGQAEPWVQVGGPAGYSPGAESARHLLPDVSSCRDPVQAMIPMVGISAGPPSEEHAMVSEYVWAVGGRCGHEREDVWVVVWVDG